MQTEYASGFWQLSAGKLQKLFQFQSRYDKWHRARNMPVKFSLKEVAFSPRTIPIMYMLSQFQYSEFVTVVDKVILYSS